MTATDIQVRVSAPTAAWARLFVCGLILALLAACSSPQVRRGEDVAKIAASLSPNYHTQIFQLDSTGLPIASVIGEDGDLWVVTEFGDSLHHVSTDPVIKIERLTVPMKAEAKQWPFVERHGWRTPLSHSERIVKDNQGRVWFPQIGSWLNSYSTRGVINHSRIVSYDPRNQQFCVYPVPDSNAAVMGVAWDEARNLVWFTQSGNNAVVSFNPDKLRDCKIYNQYRWAFDSKKELIYPFPVQYCNGSDDTNCFRKFLLPFKGKSLLNQLAVQQPGQPDAGAIWVTEFVGGHIGRFDITTGTYSRFPIDLDRAEYEAMGLHAGYYHRTHQIMVHPQNGDLVFSTNGTGQVFRFDIQHYLRNPNECMKLYRNEYNPCMHPIQVTAPKGSKGRNTTHSLSFDRFYNLWVSTWVDNCDFNTPPPSIGFIEPEWRKLIFFDNLKITPQKNETTIGSSNKNSDTGECDENGWPPKAFKGISVDQANNVWVANFFKRQIYKLNYAAGPNQNPYRLLCGENCQ